MSLCPTCATASEAWIYYRPVPSPRLISPGIRRDRDVIAARAAAENDRRDLIRSQQRLIKDICERTHQPCPQS